MSVSGGIPSSPGYRAMNNGCVAIELLAQLSGNGQQRRYTDQFPDRLRPLYSEGRFAMRLLVNVEGISTQLERRRGSRMSRRPSPRKLNPRTTIMMANPGKMAIQGEISM